MKKYLSILFVALAASFNAVTDTTWTHFPTSVFKNLDPSFWNAQESWKTAYNFLGFVRFDAYHLSKELMILSIIEAIISYKSFARKYQEFIIFGITWSLFFELLYSYTLN